MFSTFVMRPCMMRKCGLLTLSCTEWKRFCTRLRSEASEALRACNTGDAPGLRHVAVDEVLVAPANHNLRGEAAWAQLTAGRKEARLARDGDLLAVLVADGAAGHVAVVEDN